jgi:hypothetical protein
VSPPVSPLSTPDTVARDALERSIASSLLPRMSHDELRVLEVIGRRVLELGRESYAPLDLKRDERDWGKEAAEELADTLFYLAAREVAANDRRLERLRCEAADEIHRRVAPGLKELRDSRPPYGVHVEFEMPFDVGGES